MLGALPIVEVVGSLVSGASGATVSPWESFASDFSPLVFDVPFDSGAAGERRGSGVAIALWHDLLYLLVILEHLIQSGPLCIGLVISGGDEVSSRGRLVEVGCGEADMVG